MQILDEFSTLEDQEQFFRVLGSGSPSQVPEDSTAEEDGAFETKDAAAVTLYKVSDAGGTLEVDTISTKPIRQEMLKREDCFILDTGSAIYVWVGKGATQAEKTQSVARAQSKFSLPFDDALKCLISPRSFMIFRLYSNKEISIMDTRSQSG